MKILLTGATGFVGKNIKNTLSRYYTVIGVGSKDFDLRDKKQCESLYAQTSPDVVIHCAGSVGGIAANKENPGKFMYDNLVMGTNVIEEAKNHSIKKFIMLGTVCSYPKITKVPFKEDDMWLGYPEETNAPYGIAKKTLIKLIESYHEQYNFNGVNLIPVNMYGPHDHFNLTTSHVIPALILKVKKAIENKEKSITIWGTGTVSREFLFAPDLADAIHLAINNEVPPIPINIGTGKETKISELVELVCKIMSFNGEIIYDSSKPDGQPRRCLDTSRAKNILNFEAKTNLEVGLIQTIEWFTSNGD